VSAEREGEGVSSETAFKEAGPTFIRRLATLLAWLDEEYRFSADTAENELHFFDDPVHLDAYAETLDAIDWRTVTRSSGRPFYEGLARKVVGALRAEATAEHEERVRELVRSWQA
jgi:hypothetical protein